MDIPADYLAKFYKSGAPRTEREELLSRFLDRLNPSREAAGYRPYTYPRMATMLQHIPTGDLHAFWQRCETAKSFSAMFHYLLKPPAHGDTASPRR